jgi:hypothetical protein
MYELDFVSYYAAVLRRVDPFPVPTIDRMKSRDASKKES